jgi:hypothetical protein
MYRTTPGNHQTRTVGGQAYSYDANGNLQSGGGHTYTWNADNQPSSIRGTDGVREEYIYDATFTKLIGLPPPGVAVLGERVEAEVQVVESGGVAVALQK